jgi:DNA-binding beta-propeller fold protein YncE
MTSLLSISIIVMHCLSPIPDDTVTCCDLHGTTQWEFKDTSVIKGSRGISVDNDGNVYVVGGDSNNVVVLSPEGQRHRQVLSSGETRSCSLSRNELSNR